MTEKLFSGKKSEILTELTKLLVDRYGVDASSVTPKAHLLKDLSLDSLDTADLLVAVNETFQLHITTDVLANVYTVEDLVTIIYQTAARTKK